MSSKEKKHKSREEVELDFERAFDEACSIIELENEFNRINTLKTENYDEDLSRRNELAALKDKLEIMKKAYYDRFKIKPGELIEDLKKQGKKDYEIAAILYESYKLSTFKIGQLLPANPGVPIENSSISKRGRRLLKKNSDNKSLHKST